jgi:hypothetical protein
MCSDLDLGVEETSSAVLAKSRLDMEKEEMHQKLGI